MAFGLEGDPMADPGNGRGSQGVTIELVVDIMNFDQKPVRIDLSGQLGEVQIRGLQSRGRMNQIHAGPTDGGDGQRLLSLIRDGRRCEVNSI